MNFVGDHLAIMYTSYTYTLRVLQIAMTLLFRDQNNRFSLMHTFLNAQNNVSNLVETASDVFFVFDFTAGNKGWNLLVELLEEMRVSFFHAEDDEALYHKGLYHDIHEALPQL